MRTFSRRAVIAAALPEEACRLSELLRTAGFDGIFTVENGAEALRLVREQLPDALVADEVLPVLDGVSLTERLLSEPLAVYPAMLLISPRGMSRPAPEGARSLNRSVTPEALDEALSGMLPENRPIPAGKRALAGRMLDEIGIPEHPGRRYLQRAIEWVWADSRLLRSLTTRIYPALADEFGADRRHVERALRHVIDVAWRSGEIEAQYRIFGDTIDARRGNPTCGEMIAQIADILRWEGRA